MPNNPATEDRIHLARPDIRGNEQQYAADAIASNWVTTLGPYVSRLESEVAKFVGVKAACATGSGTAALHLALKLAGVKRGDVVLCASLTFCASANPIMYEGAIPIFIDSEPHSYNMSPKALEKALKQYQPKAVIVVDLYGQSADYDAILELCRQHDVVVIEDAAEALGATYRGKPCGSFGDFNVVSFNGNKIITSSGGGMLLSDNEAAMAKAQFWATQAREPARHYEHKEVGYNYRLSNVSAAIGCAQFEKLDQRIADKKKLYQRYEQAFADIDGIEMLPVCDYGVSNYWLSCARMTTDATKNPLDIIEALDQANIEARPIWKPMHLQPVFAGYDFVSHYEDDSTSVSEEIFRNGLCLPSDTTMSDDDQTRVIDIIRGVMQ